MLEDGRVVMEVGKANGYGDVFGRWWDRRNTDLCFVLTPWQYDKCVALNHFYRPVAWKAGGWTFAVYAHYDRGRFYNAHPKVFVSYKGGHNKVHGSHCAHMGHSNAHKAPNSEVAMNARSNHGGSGHFLRPSGSKRP